jgi:hypothetical protein
MSQAWNSPPSDQNALMADTTVGCLTIVLLILQSTFSLLR